MEPRRCGARAGAATWIAAAGVGAAIALAAAGSARAALADMLPPGVRSESERALVETEEPHGAHYVERIAPDAPPAIAFTPVPELESAIRRLLAEGGIALGHVLVMDPRTGELFAYVSTDARTFPATRPYPTASLMKVITAAAMLRHEPAVVRRPCEWIGNPYVLREAHLADPATPDPIPGAAPEALPAVAAAPPTGRHTPGEGGAGHAGPPTAADTPDAWSATFESALAISNNQCFARYAVRDLGAEALLEEMDRTAFAVAPAPRHAPGRIDPVETPLDLAHLGSGLGGSAITPLGAIRLAGAIATGRLVTPYWIASRRDADLGAPVVPETAPPQRIWDDDLTATLRSHLRATTETGTARRAFRREDGTPLLGSVAVAGKTGSLRGDDPAGLYQWFIGVAPADDPQLAIAAVVVHPDDAERGVSASEVAAATLAELFCDAEDDCAPERTLWLSERAPARAVEVARLQEIAAARAAEEAAAAAREREKTFDAPLRLLETPRVDLPYALRRQPREGEVMLRIDLAPDGSVVAAAVDSTDLPHRFGAFLVEKARAWRFTPPRRDGKPVSATVQLRVPVEVD